MRVLIGSCVRQTPEILKAHLETLAWQKGRFETSYAFVDDCDNTEAKLMLPGHVMAAEPKPDKAEYAVDETTHHWTMPLFGWLGRQKKRLIEYAKAGRFDALLLVDSDLLLSPETLQSLIDTGKDVVSAVFWTRWQPDSPPLPQVWLAHPYELQGRGKEAHEFLGSLARRELVRVAGLGACTLIRASVFDRVGYWPLVEGLPTDGMWQGEDRHFCIRAERNHVELWADAWPDIFHVYRPSDVARIPEMLRIVGTQRRMARGLGYVAEPILSGVNPSCGDLVSAQLQALEEPNAKMLVQHVRGRIGQLKLVPDIEDALMGMLAGETRLVRVRFPAYYEIPQYRGQVKLVKVKLLGVKPYALHPTLDGATAPNRVGEIAEAFLGEAA